MVAEPTGKQHTSAAHNPPELVAISVRRNTGPRSLANAFATAVFAKKGESLTGRSAQELGRKAKVLKAAYGGDEKTFVLNLTDLELGDYGEVVNTLTDLLDKSLAAAVR